jgi:hypothetical protein
MRNALWIAAIAALASPAAADTFSGFSAIDRPYLVNQDRVCTPLAVANGAATGAPKCEKVTADVVAKLSVKDGVVQRGSHTTFVATVSGPTITVARKSGDEIVHWDAPDPISKIIEVYTTGYEDRVAVAYSVRRAGREMTDVVAFDLIAQGHPGTAGRPHDPHDPTPGTTPTAHVEDPKITAAIKAARAAAKPKAMDAWKAVLAIDGGHSEALYQIAALHAAGKRAKDALDTLTILAGSQRPDAIEWLVEARFDAAFTSLRGDAKFRGLVGLDRKATTPYERFMGYGGQWEQAGTSCDTPEVKLVASRDHSFNLRVHSACHGQTIDMPFKGTWRADGDGIVLVLPNHGKASRDDEAPCKFELASDEDALHCALGHDIDFVVLPTRR